MRATIDALEMLSCSKTIKVYASDFVCFGILILAWVPSRKPFLNLLWTSFRCLILPVPVTRLRLAFSLQLSTTSHHHIKTHHTEKCTYISSCVQLGRHNWHIFSSECDRTFSDTERTKCAIYYVASRSWKSLSSTLETKIHWLTSSRKPLIQEDFNYHSPCFLMSRGALASMRRQYDL